MSVKDEQINIMSTSLTNDKDEGLAVGQAAALQMTSLNKEITSIKGDYLKVVTKTLYVRE